MTILEAVDKALESATHLSDEDAGTVEALRALARKIDAWDTIVEWALDDAVVDGVRPKVPANDNTSLPTFLKYCEALGLTPGSRKELGVGEAVEVDPIDELKRKRRARAQAAG